MAILNPTLSDKDNIARIKAEISSLEKAIESLKKQLAAIPDMEGAEKLFIAYLANNVTTRRYSHESFNGIRWEDKDSSGKSIMSLDNHNLLYLPLPPSLVKAFENECHLSKDEIKVVIKNVLTHRYGIHYEGIW